jgi:hypothetical protein
VEAGDDAVDAHQQVKAPVRAIHFGGEDVILEEALTRVGDQAVSRRAPDTGRRLLELFRGQDTVAQLDSDPVAAPLQVPAQALVGRQLLGHVPLAGHVEPGLRG